MNAEPRTVPVPPFGQGLDEVLIIAWTAAPGQRVARGQRLAEVETAKATHEIYADCAGTLLELKARPGDILGVGAPLYTIEPAEGA